MQTLTADDFPPGTALRHFFAWNAARRRPDPRYARLRHPDRLPAAIAEPLAAAVDNADVAAHAAVFAALEPAHAGRRAILVIRLSAFGDFIQSLGPFAAIRRHHAGDHITLLTTRAYARFAEELGLFDAVLIDARPGPFDLGGWLALRRRLRQGQFDRVYDLQTAQRSSAYSWLLRPHLPEWSGIAWRSSHPHADLDRDRRHTLDKQAEQLLMSGIHPTPLPRLPPLGGELPMGLAGRRFVMLAPGSSPQHTEKRWPAASFAALARALSETGQIPVVVGTAEEAPLAATICSAAPAAVDLTGRTDLVLLGALAQRAALTVGNDTGTCHLAAAADCPVLVLFSRASDPARVAPRGRCVRVLAVPALGDLAPATVIAEAMAMLAPDLAARTAATTPAGAAGRPAA